MDNETQNDEPVQSEPPEVPTSAPEIPADQLAADGDRVIGGVEEPDEG